MQAIGISPDKYTLTEVLLACARGRQGGMAKKLFEKFSSFGLEPDLFACNVAMKSFVFGGQWEETIRVFDTLQELGYKLNAYTYIAVMNANNSGKQYAKTLSMFEAMQREVDAAEIQHKIKQVHLAVQTACSHLGQYEHMKDLQRKFNFETKSVEDIVSESNWNSCTQFNITLTIDNNKTNKFITFWINDEAALV